MLVQVVSDYKLFYTNIINYFLFIYIEKQLDKSYMIIV